MPIVRLDQIQQFAAINLNSDPGAIGGKVHVPNCAQIKLYWLQEDGRIAHNILYGRFTGPFAGTPTQATGIMTALTTGAAWTALAGFLASSTSLSTVSIRNVDAIDQPEILSTGGSVPGTSVSPALPNEVAVCVTIKTANAGHSGHGRLYVPGFSTNALGAGNVVNGATVTAVQNWAATITGAINANGYQFVLGLQARQAYTGRTGTEHPARDATSVPVTSVVVRDNHWDSQRRRGLK